MIVKCVYLFIHLFLFSHFITKFAANHCFLFLAGEVQHIPRSGEERPQECGPEQLPDAGGEWLRLRRLRHGGQPDDRPGDQRPLRGDAGKKLFMISFIFTIQDKCKYIANALYL